MSTKVVTYLATSGPSILFLITLQAFRQRNKPFLQMFITLTFIGDNFFHRIVLKWSTNFGYINSTDIKSSIFANLFPRWIRTLLRPTRSGHEGAQDSGIRRTWNENGWSFRKIISLGWTSVVICCDKRSDCNKHL